MYKVGLITIHDTINFGSQLQTYSLYKAVESLGIDVKLIDYKCEAISERESTHPLAEVKNVKDFIKFLVLHKNLEKRKQEFHKFMDKNMSITKQYDKSTIKNTNELFDTFLVGSDIVWGLNITGNDYTYMLDFAEEKKKKISFSSSVGTKWKDDEAAQVRKCLKRFDDIAVRETDAAEWIKELIKSNVKVTCDPTMLWDRKFWTKYVEKKDDQKKYILVYMSDPENKCIKQAIQYGKIHGMPVYYINYRAPVWGVVDKRPTSLEEWLELFYNAETVFSASYHGLLFSLYFQKNVYYFNWVNKSRMDSLANVLGIQDREGTVANIEKDLPINYNAINERLDSIRNESWNVLRRMLNE